MDSKRTVFSTAGFLGVAGTGMLAVVLGLLGLAPMDLAQAQPGRGIPEPTIGPDVPKEVEIAGEPPIAFFDDFSWRSFVALNWPADVSRDQRGVPDRSRKIGDVSVPTVWDTWKADFELFQPKGAPPSEWASYQAVNPCETEGWPLPVDNHPKILAQFSKLGGLNQAGFGVDGPALVSQNRAYVRYEVRINRLEHDFIRDRKLYLAANLPKQGDPPLAFTSNSIEVKGAWREVHGDEMASMGGRYYIVKARVMNPVKGVCEDKSMALVGFHIVQKTPQFPQWVWSTFEQEDNVPEAGGALGHPFSLNDGDPGRQKMIPEKAPKPLGPDNPPQENPAAMQVVRLNPIAGSTQETNARYQAALKGTVWAHYRLVMTQWPTDTTKPDGVPFPRPGTPNPPTNTANTAMETYFQQTSQSCMKCHDLARRKGLDFVWFVPLRAYTPEGPRLHAARAKTPRDQALDDLRKFIAAGEKH
ncbi:MAG TPA: hypothetical protein VGH73_09925 [Thermoanaerobaculia bacterium]|jgi:hypothetical protein